MGQEAKNVIFKNKKHQKYSNFFNLLNNKYLFSRNEVIDPKLCFLHIFLLKWSLFILDSIDENWKHVSSFLSSKTGSRSVFICKHLLHLARF